MKRWRPFGLPLHRVVLAYGTSALAMIVWTVASILLFNLTEAGLIEAGLLQHGGLLSKLLFGVFVLVVWLVPLAQVGRRVDAYFSRDFYEPLEFDFSGRNDIFSLDMSDYRPEHVKLALKGFFKQAARNRKKVVGIFMSTSMLERLSLKQGSADPLFRGVPVTTGHTIFVGTIEVTVAAA
ncbi:hypothetical protein [Dongia sp.]|uniref:hypothetical protein n=1 Tax=Dongia sp. TaxID=1977262 RepID=UPI0037531502